MHATIFLTRTRWAIFTVFNIKKNEYRLITVIHYNRFKVYVRVVLKHSDYDKGNWKDD